ncbi:MAG: Nramp family divalent metal transporter [Phycisphaeraceae bacterium]
MSDQDQPLDEPALIQAPPHTFGGILRKIGPGMILAGSIVGSGELIATTRVGSEAGFTLLWLILVGCIVKVFVQIELGRYAIINAKTTLAALDSVPGPRITLPLGKTAMRGNLITWFWLIMFLATIGQLGGIVGGVGQGLAISVPLTAEGRQFNQDKVEQVTLKVKQARLDRLTAGRDASDPLAIEEGALMEELTGEIAQLKPRVEKSVAQSKAYDDFNKAKAKLAASPDDANLKAEVDALKAQVDTLGTPPSPLDDKYWAAILGVVTAVMLASGRYKFVEVVSIIFVITFTIITIGNLVALQFNNEWAVTMADLGEGLSLQLPESDGSSFGGKSAVATALAAFGIIGVGASELMAYPYWCLEKGYAKWTGKADGSPGWLARAKGWLRVMKWDAWASMVLYTIATIVFYLLGAAVLHRSGLHPNDDELIRTLSIMYQPVFGSYAPTLFLIGAIAVLYSTFFSANAANARQAADIIPAFGIHPVNEVVRRRWVRFFCAFFPLACVVIYCFIPKPVTLVLISGVMQALMLPLLGIAALYFRYRQCDARLKPGLAWDIMLWISFIAFFIVGAYLAYVNLIK